MRLVAEALVGRDVVQVVFSSQIPARPATCSDSRGLLSAMASGGSRSSGQPAMAAACRVRRSGKRQGSSREADVGQGRRLHVRAAPQLVKGHVQQLLHGQEVRAAIGCSAVRCTQPLAASTSATSYIGAPSQSSHALMGSDGGLGVVRREGLAHKVGVGLVRSGAMKLG